MLYLNAPLSWQPGMIDVAVLLGNRDPKECAAQSIFPIIYYVLYYLSIYLICCMTIYLALKTIYFYLICFFSHFSIANTVAVIHNIYYSSLQIEHWVSGMLGKK